MRFVNVLHIAGLVAAACAQGAAQESRTVVTAQGPVRGYKTDDDIFDFYGIPYATAPTGLNRFKPPLPGPTWTEPLDALNRNVICLQSDFTFVDISPYTMQEDCLIANVHVPDTDESNLPVMVYVHGGGYQLGMGSMTTTHGLVKSKKIVAVTFNYRLGVHGFLCLGTEGAPGNAGMKDQVALLRWVQQNIANFGGNPDDVTIVGSSAGSGSVELLMLSEITEGLFHKVVPESGSGVSVWAVALDPVQSALDFAKNNNFSDTGNLQDLEEYYTTASYDTIRTEIFFDRKNFTFSFVPCVERDIGQEMFLKEAPLDILEQGNFRKVPVLYGFTNMEGLIRISFFEQWKDEMNSNFSDFLPADLQFESEIEKTVIANIVKEFYFGADPVSEDTVLDFINYSSDAFINYPHLRSTQLQLAAGSDSIYLYEYTYFNPPLPSNNTPEYLANIRGANHHDQSIAIHNISMYGPRNFPTEYLEVTETLREIWLNFITTGKPVPEGSALPEWPPVGPDLSPHMELTEPVQLRGPLLQRRALFWDVIYELFARTPVPPTPAISQHNDTQRQHTRT